MSAGYALTGDERFRHCAEAGIDFLENHFRDFDESGYFWSCAPDGRVVDDTKRSYGHAFVIFALAEATLAFEKPEYCDRAKRVWSDYQSSFGLSGGGYVNVANRSFEAMGDRFSQNPIMHLFEALLSLSRTTAGGEILQEALSIADFVIETLIDAKSGLLPELFDRNWSPLAETDGNSVSIGHAFEWAFLLSQAVQLGCPDRLLAPAHHFLNTGCGLGFDRERGSVVSSASLDGGSVTNAGSYWEQCEALRSMLHFARYRDRREMSHNFDCLAAFVHRYYLDDEYGGWYTSVEPEGSPSNAAKGSLWKLDYHPTTMCLEFERIIERRKQNRTGVVRSRGMHWKQG